MNFAIVKKFWVLYSASLHSERSGELVFAAIEEETKNQ